MAAIYRPEVLQGKGLADMAQPRKKKTEGETRENVLRIRLTEEERALLDQAAETKTLETSTWARSELIALAKKVFEQRDKKD